MAFGRVQRNFRQIHCASVAERRGKALVNQSYCCWRLPFRDGSGQSVENRPRARRVIAGQSSRDLFGVGEEPVCLVELIFRDELTVLVDRLRVLLDGDTNDAG